MRTYRIGARFTGHFGPLTPASIARGCSGVSRSGDGPPYPDTRSHQARFGARFTPSNEPGGLVWRNPHPALSQGKEELRGAEMRGSRLCGNDEGCSVSGQDVAKLLILFQFGSISFHSLSSTRAGIRGSRLRGNDGILCVNDVCEQCSKRRSFGAMGSCRRNCSALMRRMRCV